MKEWLERAVGEEEAWEAVEGCAGAKAPGSDSYFSFFPTVLEDSQR